MKGFIDESSHVRARREYHRLFANIGEEPRPQFAFEQGFRKGETDGYLRALGLGHRFLRMSRAQQLAIVLRHFGLIPPQESAAARGEEDA